MVTVSPPVSPRVVAAILMIQKPRVTAGTLLIVGWSSTSQNPRKVILRARTSGKSGRTIARSSRDKTPLMHSGTGQPTTSCAAATSEALAPHPSPLPASDRERGEGAGICAAAYLTGVPPFKGRGVANQLSSCFYRMNTNRKPRYYGRAPRDRGAPAAPLGVSAK